MIKITRDEFSGTTTGRHYRSTWVIRFVDFGKKVHDRCARCDGNDVFGSVRKVTIGDKSVCIDELVSNPCQPYYKKQCHLIVCGLHPGIGQPSKLPMHHPYQQI